MHHQHVARPLIVSAIVSLVFAVVSCSKPADPPNSAKAGDAVLVLDLRPIGVGNEQAAVINLGLTALKAVAGVLPGSSVMVADAVHSLSDLATDAVSLVSLRLACAPATLSLRSRC